MAMARTAWLRKAGGGLLDLLFPPSCLACEAALDEVIAGVSLCESCLGQLAGINWPVCQRCGERVPETPGDVADCGHCRRDKPRFDRVLAWGEYEGLLRELLLKMKRDRSERLARMFSRLLLADLGEQLSASNFDAVVAAPMSGWRRFERGTDAPAVIAQIVGHELGVPFKRGVVCRRNSGPQKDLSRLSRFQNMRNKMWPRAGYYLGSFRVLLIDDILTTGATCSEAARVLKQVGAAEVTVLVVGRTSTN